ncbi:LysR substrate-binding domain-containing protein [Seongchinamella sediminis]|uniref:LysR substrate-binding domain-containing protein n=1 Tax=Seongchinamella sediminis TaxID=2283635 RepID=UPI001EF1123E|nr:LysR substrate-binding domain-containing protein [Seongchinamella sediminis]
MSGSSAWAVSPGLGLVQLPGFYLGHDIQQGTLVPVLEAYRPTDSGVWAVYPHNRHLSAKVRLFVNFLADRFNR